MRCMAPSPGIQSLHVPTTYGAQHGRACLALYMQTEDPRTTPSEHTDQQQTQQAQQSTTPMPQLSPFGVAVDTHRESLGPSGPAAGLDSAHLTHAGGSQMAMGCGPSLASMPVASSALSGGPVSRRCTHSFL